MDPLGSGIPVFSTNRNPFVDTPSTTEKQVGKPYTTLESGCRPTRTVGGSMLGSVASPASIVTRGIRETEALRKDFGQSMAQLKHVQAKLAQENKDKAQRAEVLIKEMNEMRTELVELEMEGRFDQNKLESSIASISDLIRQRENLVYVRMSEMTAVMKERDRQTDKRLKLISEMMHHGTLILRTAWCHDL